MSFTFSALGSPPSPPGFFGTALPVKSKDSKTIGTGGVAISVPAATASDSQRAATASPGPESEKSLPINSKHAASTQKQIPIDKNVFYNEETLKYMRIIDTYKKLGIGKDIELPRVQNSSQNRKSLG